MNENLFEEQEKKNREKYGNRDDDLIARTFRDNIFSGYVWCATNIQKYIKRFLTTTGKGMNLMDLYKVRDYLDRMIEVAEKDAETKKGEIVDKVN